MTQKSCSVVRRSPRTEGCKTYAEEKLPRPPSSNFISHLDGKKNICKNLPERASFSIWAQEQGGELPRSTTGMTAAGDLVTGTPAQREMMHGFTQGGFEHPAQKVTKKGWREHFVKAIIRDDLAFRLGEGAGMMDLLTYILPRGYSIPSHQTVRRDLDLLYCQLDTKVDDMIEVRIIFPT